MTMTELAGSSDVVEIIEPAEIKNRGVQDVCIAVCDGLKGLPEAITATWELATVQAC
jgi:hypothetical protein